MKKFFVSLAVVCMISLLAVSAFAYNAVEGKDWVTSIKVDTEAKKVTITYGEDFLKAYAPNGVRVAVFSAKPNMDATADFKGEEGGHTTDVGFWITYGGAEGQDIMANPEDNSTKTLVTGNPNAISGEIDASALEEGKTYYLTVTGNNQGLSPDWTWTKTVFEFKYSNEQKPTADFSVIAYAVAAITGCGALVVAKKRG